MKLLERFVAKVNRDDATSCWTWRGSLDRNGYARFGYRGTNCLAHRVSYELFNGSIPEGLEVDHLCFNKRCVNPTHLEAVTPRENVQRYYRLKTHCPHGHEFTPENTRIRPRGWRECRACIRKRKRMRRLAALTAATGLALAPAATAHDLTASQKRVYKHRWQLSAYKIAWYTGRGRWTLRPRFDRCAQIRFAKPRGRCFRHRQNYRWHRARVARIGRLLWPPAPKPSLSPQGGWLVDAFLCIYRGENAGYGWSANTGNGYYGGLQMDLDFQRSYGRDYLARYGTADRWPPAAQIEVAIRAHQSGRGFGPWPNTARACGLL